MVWKWFGKKVPWFEIFFPDFGWKNPVFPWFPWLEKVFKIFPEFPDRWEPCLTNTSWSTIDDFTHYVQFNTSYIFQSECKNEYEVITILITISPELTPTGRILFLYPWQKWLNYTYFTNKNHLNHSTNKQQRHSMYEQSFDPFKNLQ